MGRAFQTRKEYIFFKGGGGEFRKRKELQKGHGRTKPGMGGGVATLLKRGVSKPQGLSLRGLTEERK